MSEEGTFWRPGIFLQGYGRAHRQTPSEEKKEVPLVVDHANRPHPQELSEREPWMMLPGVSAQTLLDILQAKQKRGEICDCHKCIHKFHELRFHLKAQADFDSCDYRDGNERRDMPAWFHANVGHYVIHNRLIEE